MAGEDQVVLLYDANCRRCRAFRSLVETVDLHHRIDARPMDDPRARALLQADDARYRASFHLVGGGDTRSAGEALARLVVLLPFGDVTAEVFRALPGLRPFLAVAYRFIAHTPR